MRVIGSIVPAMTIMIVALLAALPWGIGPEHRFFLPHIVYLVIHYWTVRYPSRVPELVVFLSGLTVDVLTSGPLGYWSLIFLAGYVIAVFQAPRSSDGKMMRWLLFVSALILVVLIEWGVASLYYFDWADWRPYVIAAIGVVVAYPVAALVLNVIEAPRTAAPSLRSGQRG